MNFGGELRINSGIISSKLRYSSMVEKNDTTGKSDSLSRKRRPRSKSKDSKKAVSPEMMDETVEVLAGDGVIDSEFGKLGDEPKENELEEVETLEHDLEQEIELAIERELAQRASAADFDTSSSSSDTVRDYLRLIGQIPLLTHDQEKDYAKRIEIGLYAVKVRDDNVDKLDAKKRRALDSIIADGRRAKHSLTEANLRLVVSLAKRYSSKSMRFQDLIQEGNNGLARAVDKYDFSKTFRFSTYATWWIRQSITRAMADQGRTIRIPVHMVEVINRLSRTEKMLRVDLGREPTAKEIANAMEVTEERVLEIRRYRIEPTLISTKIGTEGGEGTEITDMIEDPDQLAHNDVTFNKFVQASLFSIIDMLPEKEQKVIIMRYGLVDQVEHTLDEVGRLLGLTRERIRQIEQRAMDKLSHAAFSSAMSDISEFEYE
jgi:RNA polymerase sigma factor (sigma-70 family)